MLKPLTLSLSLAVALGMSSVSMAGLFGNDSGCSTCGLASPQGVVAPSAQSYSPVVASAQCDTGCAPAPSCGTKKLFSCFNKPKVYTYEWVLKKKRVWGHKASSCGVSSCSSCESYAPSIAPSAQSYSSPQSYGTPQSYGSPQAYAAPAYGSGQAYGAPQATSTSTPAPHSDEAPPLNDAAPAQEAPAQEAPTGAANAPQSSLLFSTPAGN